MAIATTFGAKSYQTLKEAGADQTKKVKAKLQQPMRERATYVHKNTHMHTHTRTHTHTHTQTHAHTQKAEQVGSADR